MEKISWKKAKGGRAFENLLEGFYKKELCFMIEGGLCLTDLRGSRKSETYIPPKNYPLTSDDRLIEAKVIAYELLNGINLDEHENNRQKWEDRHKQSQKVLEKAQEFLNKLKNK